jgi:enoyl-CoA hydratase/carnithine racemase
MIIIDTYLSKEYAIIRLNKSSSLNALDKHLMSSLTTALLELQSNPLIKCVGLMSTSPKAFCAGADIHDIANSQYAQVLDNDTMQAFRSVTLSFSKPLIIAANGYVLGGGFELALAADILLCTKDTQFALPEINLGVVPGIGGTQRLAKLLGRQYASYMVMTGNRMNSE